MPLLLRLVPVSLFVTVKCSLEDKLCKVAKYIWNDIHPYDDKRPMSVECDKKYACIVVRGMKYPDHIHHFKFNSFVIIKARLSNLFITSITPTFVLL